MMLSLLCLVFFDISMSVTKTNKHHRSDTIEIWDQFQMELNGPNSGNPFEDYQLSSTFTSPKGIVFQNVYGFYDGDSNYKIRFMPNEIGLWKYITISNVESMNNITGQFTAINASSTNYGPAYRNPLYPNSFIYANGIEYFSVGTTSYSWTNAPFEWNYQQQTIDTLKYVWNNNIFNKFRYALFPTYGGWGNAQPSIYPYSRNNTNSLNDWNFKYFNVTFFQYFDNYLQQIFDIANGNFIVDLILFHPYDNGEWGFDCMGGTDPNTYDTTNDEFYLKYIISRVASFRHVWWSMGNEYDSCHCKSKGMPQTFPIWDTLFGALIKYDPYTNPEKEKSIHQAATMYNYSQPWTTHFSVQGYQGVPGDWLRNKYKVLKPVIIDEAQYEGNCSSFPSEDLTAGVETDMFWMGLTGGNYVGHSEMIQPIYNTPAQNVTVPMWENYGGKLLGDSPVMIAWFREFMTNINKYKHPPFSQLNTTCIMWAWQTGFENNCLIDQLYKENVYYLFHWTDFYMLTNIYHSTINIPLKSSDIYQVQYIDYLNQQISTIDDSFSGDYFMYTPKNTPWNLQLTNTKFL